MAPARTRRQIHELPFSFIDCVRSFLHERSTFPSPPVIDFGVEQQRDDVPLSSSPNLGVGSAALPPRADVEKSCAGYSRSGTIRMRAHDRVRHDVARVIIFSSKSHFELGCIHCSALFVDDTT